MKTRLEEHLAKYGQCMMAHHQEPTLQWKIHKFSGNHMKKSKLYDESTTEFPAWAELIIGRKGLFRLLVTFPEEMVLPSNMEDEVLLAKG